MTGKWPSFLVTRAAQGPSASCPAFPAARRTQRQPGAAPEADSIQDSYFKLTLVLSIGGLLPAARVSFY